MTDDEDDPYRDQIYSPESSDGGTDGWTTIGLIIVGAMFFGLIYILLMFST